LDDKGDLLPGTREAPDGTCCVAEVQNEKEQSQISDAKCPCGLRRAQTSGGAPGNGRGGGVRST